MGSIVRIDQTGKNSGGLCAGEMFAGDRGEVCSGRAVMQMATHCVRWAADADRGCRSRDLHASCIAPHMIGARI